MEAPKGVQALTDILVREGVLSETVARRIGEAAGTRATFLSAALRAGANESQLAAALSSCLGVPGVDLSRSSIDLAVLEGVPRIVAESDLVLPLSAEGGRLHVAVSGALDEHPVLEELRFISGREVSAYVAVPGMLEAAIAAAYDALERGGNLWRGAQAPAGPESSLAVVTPDEPRLDPAEAFDELPLEVGDDDEDEQEVLHAERVRVGPPHLFAVDDDPDILRLLDRALRSAGYTVDLAKDGREAEAKLTANRYDLVLLDAMLPHVHGFELCARLKASPRTRDTPVILVSAVYRGWRYAQDARETFGADDYVEKPFHLPELLRRVKARLEQQPTITAHFEQAEELYQQGLTLLEAGKKAEARALLERATRDDPFSARAHFALARVLQTLGDSFGAITAYEKSIELRPNLFSALHALATLYEGKGFRRKAAEALERALLAAPDRSTREEIRNKLLRLI